ncbi:MAG: hypothetical protein IPN43_10990 [Chitinophagaceae bacterium]|nr:hypothetical protein [Chitinophagaceae bacterium]
MKIKKIGNILLVILCFIACNNNHSVKPKKKDYTASINDFADENIYKYFTHALSLTPLQDNDTDSFELRLWVYKSPFNPQDLLIVKYNDTLKELKWKLIDLNVKITNADSFAVVKRVDKLFDYISLDSMIIKNPLILCTVRQFFLQIDSLSIETLPNQIDIDTTKAKSVFIDGGLTYYIQIVKKRFYKSVSYRAPEYYGSKDEYNKRVLKFIDFLQTNIR